ncbi:ester cyclase [Leifsonia kafniensis]|uniref:Ester cyclase n=1 Tax=Leifsonia kafniensis TaxID=475957 RepID=A0ABP7L673_9MICO
MDNETMARSAYDHLNAGDIDKFGDLLADDFIEYELTPGFEPTKSGVKDFFRMQKAAFPDMKIDVQDVVVSGEKVVVRARFTGTNQGDFMGMAASGKSVNVQLIDIFRVGSDGLVHEHWGVYDALGMMQQIGAVPAGPPAE